jgi:hypothetical protein
MGLHKEVGAPASGITAYQASPDAPDKAPQTGSWTRASPTTPIVNIGRSLGSSSAGTALGRSRYAGSGSYPVLFARTADQRYSNLSLVLEIGDEYQFLS